MGGGGERLEIDKSPQNQFLAPVAHHVMDNYNANLLPGFFCGSLLGTRIIYDRSFLMNLKNSPVARTPPKDFLPPGIAKGSSPVSSSQLSVSPKSQFTKPAPAPKKSVSKDEEQFDMDM